MIIILQHMKIDVLFIKSKSTRTLYLKRNGRFLSYPKISIRENIVRENMTLFKMEAGEVYERSHKSYLQKVRRKKKT